MGVLATYRARELNPDEGFPPAVFKTAASAISPARHRDSMGQQSVRDMTIEITGRGSPFACTGVPDPSALTDSITEAMPEPWGGDVKPQRLKVCSYGVGAVARCSSVSVSWRAGA